MKLGYLVLGMADKIHPIAYCERWGAYPPPYSLDGVGGECPPPPSPPLAMRS